MTDHYELLGVDADADKDAIRAAYREQLDGATQADRAKLNKAWNVLSDPVQRGRYDDELASSDVVDLTDEDDDDVPVPARRGARPARAAAGSRDRGAARPTPEPTVVLPAGMQLAETRPRGLALLIDFSILFVIYMIAFTAILPATLKSQYPAQTKTIDRINDEIKDLDDKKANVDDRADKAKGEAKQALEQESKQLQKQIDTKEDRVADIAKEFQGFALLMYSVLLVIMLLYVVPSTALTGQTLGQKLRQVRVVKVDGSPVGWLGAFGRYFVPLSIALLLPQLGALIGLGMVLWFLRDKNRQGVHDKLARTLVVDAS